MSSESRVFFMVARMVLSSPGVGRRGWGGVWVGSAGGGGGRRGRLREIGWQVEAELRVGRDDGDGGFGVGLRPDEAAAVDEAGHDEGDHDGGDEEAAGADALEVLASRDEPDSTHGAGLGPELPEILELLRLLDRRRSP